MHRCSRGAWSPHGSLTPPFPPPQVKWVRPFGAGAYSIVYLGWWKDKLYAIKAINKKHMIDIKQVGRARRRFVEELFRQATRRRVECLVAVGCQEEGATSGRAT